VPAELEVTLSGPESAEVGADVHFEILIHNRGAGPATGLLVSDRFDAGLQHAKSAGAIEKDLADLPPGGMARVEVDFRVVQAGELCQEVTVTGSAGLSAKARKCITAAEPASPAEPAPPVAEPPPAAEPPREAPPAATPSLAPRRKLTIQKTGPEQKRVGETALFTIEITNDGEEVVENLEIADHFETSLQPIRATEGSTMLKGNALGWKVERLEPGKSLRRAVEFNCLRETNRACNRVTVTASDVEPLADEACLEILGDQTAQPPAAEPPGAEPAPTPAEAMLSVTVADTADPIKVKQETSYQILITNKGTQSAFDVELTVNYSGELAIETFNGPVRATVTPGTLRFVPVREFRSGEAPLNFELRAVGAKPGAARVQVSVTRRGQAQPLTAEQTTEVLAQPE
jgi:uncharacterized repeat protein (TIGR01451 family)